MSNFVHLMINFQVQANHNDDKQEKQWQGYDGNGTSLFQRMLQFQINPSNSGVRQNNRIVGGSEAKEGDWDWTACMRQRALRIIVASSCMLHFS